MTIKKHPEWTKKYPAIDGIAKSERPSGDYFYPEEKAIRSDIEEILKMNDTNFNRWYNKRKVATENMLKQYEIIGSIPSLNYPFEKFQNKLTASSYISGPINVLKEGLDYLEKVKEVREEYKK
jgi:hypothetical protein